MKQRIIFPTILLLVGLSISVFAQRSRSDKFIASANALLSTGEYEQALAQYTRAIELSPKESEYYTLRGFAKDILGNFEDGIGDFDKAIKLDHKNYTAYNNRGYAYFAMGKEAQALADYGTSIKINPAFIPPYSNRALIYTKMGLYDEALADLNVAIYKVHEPNSSLYNLRGYCLYSIGKHKAAIDEYSKAIKIDEQYADAYFNRAVAKYNIGDSIGAYNDFIVAKRNGHPEADNWLIKYKPKKNHL